MSFINQDLSQDDIALITDMRSVCMKLLIQKIPHIKSFSSQAWLFGEEICQSTIFQGWYVWNFPKKCSRYPVEKEYEYCSVVLYSSLPCELTYIQAIMDVINTFKMDYECSNLAKMQMIAISKILETQAIKCQRFVEHVRLACISHFDDIWLHIALSVRTVC